MHGRTPNFYPDILILMQNNTRNVIIKINLVSIYSNININSQFSWHVASKLNSQLNNILKWLHWSLYVFLFRFNKYIGLVLTPILSDGETEISVNGVLYWWDHTSDQRTVVLFINKTDVWNYCTCIFVEKLNHRIYMRVYDMYIN